MNFLREVTIVILHLPCLVGRANAVLWTFDLLHLDSSKFVKSLYLQCVLLPADVSPLSWSHVLMDGNELEDK